MPDLGEEIFVHYGYDLDGCPEWYEEAWARGTYPIPDSLQEELANWEVTDYDRSADCTRLKDFVLKDQTAYNVATLKDQFCNAGSN